METFDLEKELTAIDTPSKEGVEVSNKDKEIFDKSYSIIKDAMNSVIQEIVINLDNESHIVYIHKLNLLDNGQIEIDWSTPSEAYKSQLYPHVEKCIKIQITEELQKYKPSLFGIFKRG